METIVKTDIRQKVTDTIIEILKTAQKLEYSQPWIDITGGSAENPLSGTIYRGVNQLILSFMAYRKNHAVNRWLTFSQIQTLKAKIKKGSKAQPVIFYTVIKKDDTTTEPADKHLPRKVLKSYNVFNVCDIEGLPLAYYQAPELPTLEAWQKDDKAEDLLIRSGAKIEYKPQNRAFYSPMDDKIVLPIREQFIADEPFYATAFHELTHWTGHPDRLNREKGKKFGDKNYAYEELIAELGAAFMCAHLGFSKYITQNAAYIQSWLTALKSDKSFIFSAAAKAQEALDFIIKQQEAANIAA